MKKLASLKFYIVIGLAIVAFALSTIFPSLARFKNRTRLEDVVSWDGSVATSFKKGTGTESDPYVITTGAELAYLSETLNVKDYNGEYVVLGDDIVLNEGVFNYLEDKLTYTINGNTYYIKEYTKEYYSDSEYKNLVGRVNTLTPLNNFKGTFIGDSNTIFGLYVTSNSSDKLGLFTNLSGKVEDIYLENTLIYGGYISAALASDITNNTVENIFVSGNIISNSSNKEESKNILFDDILSARSEEKLKVNELILGKVTSSKLEGTISSVNGETLINGNSVTESNFSINLGASKLNEITITGAEGLTITNLKYTVNYEFNYASGIVGLAKNSTLKGTINKATIRGNLDSAGLIAVATNTNVNMSYNKGSINGISAAGLINYVSLNTVRTSITNSYNSGSTNKGSIISKVNNSTQINITNTFSANNDYFIDEVVSTTVLVNNSYNTSDLNVRTGSVSGSITKTTEANLKNKTFGKGTLSFYEFVDFNNLNNNRDNVWVYEEDEYPILYIDDLTNPVASIHAGTYAWDGLGYKLKNINFSSNITYSITENDPLRPVSEVYYYIHKSPIPLTKSEIDSITEWTTYKGVSSIKEQGYYIIYAKVIDTRGNTYLLNTDLLILDLTGADIEINISSKSYDSFGTPNYLYINETKTLTIKTHDEYSGVKSTEYLVSNTVLTSEELENSVWTNYTGPIKVSSSSPVIYYVKAVDNCGFITYANTDFISLNGFSEGNITLGNNTSNVLNNINITDKSSISLELAYNDTNYYTSSEVHNLVSNVLLPKGTSITLYDLKNNKVYKYDITSSEDIYNFNKNGYATYALSLFKETSKASVDNYFSDTIFRNKVIEDRFKVTVDFRNANISDDIKNIKIYMNITDNNKVTRSTLTSSVKTFNVINDSDSSLFIESSFNGGILLNSNSSISVKFKAGINYQTKNDKTIYDTLGENKSIGIMIKAYDSSNNLITKRNIRNLVITLDGEEYAPDINGIFRINLNNGLNVSNKTLVIKTTEDNMKLLNGTYTLNISSFIAYDGVYSNELSSDAISIPITVSSSNTSRNYSFNVSYDDSNRIISKEDVRKLLTFKLYEDGDFVSPNIRVSLYKKDKLTAYEQDYTLVDLKDYVNDYLIKYSNKIYYASSNSINGVSSTFNLTLLPGNFENTGYKLVFDLYDGNTKVGSIEKKFIVR